MYVCSMFVEHKRKRDRDHTTEKASLLSLSETRSTKRHGGEAKTDTSHHHNKPSFSTS
jgi:hypothetical protein